MIEAPTWKPSNQEYHRAPGISATRFKEFLRSPRLFHQRHVERTLPAEKPNSAMIIGSLVNTLLLEPESELTDIRVSERGKTSKHFRELTQRFHDKQVVTQEERQLAGAIADAVLNPATEQAAFARTLLCELSGYSEYAARWIDEPTGIACRMKLDRVIDLDGATIVELKSTRSPDPAGFSRAVDTLGYDIQAAWNIGGLSRVTGSIPNFIIVAVGNEPPHEVCCYKIDSMDLEASAREIRAGLDRLAICYADESNASWCHSWERLGEDLITITSPPWKKRSY